MDFVHLHVHSEYSLVDGLVRLEPLMKSVQAFAGASIALTDQSNLFATVKFFQAAEAAGIKPIIGTDVWIYNDQNPNDPHRLLLLCQNDVGYRHLMQLVSRAYQEGQLDDKPQIQKNWLQSCATGLIAIAHARESDIGKALLMSDEDKAAQLLHEWMTLFNDRFYLEITRTKREHEEAYLQAAVRAAEKYNCPVVATNAVRFLRRTDFEAHEARVCIHEGRTVNDPDRKRNYTEEQYLKTPEEMKVLFADLPEALENSVEIAKRCTLELSLGKIYLPNYPVPEGVAIEQFFVEESRSKLRSKFAPGPVPEIYCERLETELTVLNKMGYAGYFLIVADFIHWAKANKIPVGPGRGSGAGSLVAYCLEITGLDPLKYDLLFERFLNPERTSMPDFDIDFCMDGRDRVIDYVANTYGRDSVSQIITYGTMTAKAVIRDVGRVLGHPYGFVDKIAKLIPFELGITLQKALAEEETLRRRYTEEEEVRTLIELAKKLEGVVRNAGKHAGGVVIAPSKLTDFTPLYCDANDGTLITQFDKNDVESIGLVKFDFLGLRTLTIIDWAMENVNAIRRARSESEIDIAVIPLDDPKVFTLLRSCQTTAVFQLESRGMKDLLKRLKPDDFEEIIALVALFRPGPLQSGMVDDFINRKHGRAQPEYLHPKLVAVLKPTYGIILYQEQVMQIAQILAGYTLGAADLLRRAMGKKKPEEMAKQREIFVSGAVERGVDKAKASYIFDLMEKFAGYGFNKSHSAAYALITYQTAWIKTHYKEAFMAAVLSSDMNHTDKVVIFIRECRALNITVLPPDVNNSQFKFSVDDQNRILYGLGAIKGVGESAIESIFTARMEGPFTDLLDFYSKVDTRKITRRVLEALIRAGAFDSFGQERSFLMCHVETVVSTVEQLAKNKRHGQADLFGNPSTDTLQSNQQKIEVAPWSDAVRLSGEKETLGLYLSGHPLEQYEQDLAQIRTNTISDMRFDRSGKQVVAGLISAVKTTFTKKGDKIAFVTLDDVTGTQEIVIFSDLYESRRELLVKDGLVIIEGEISPDKFSGGFRMRCTNVRTLEHAKMYAAHHLKVVVDAQKLPEDFIERLTHTFQPHQDDAGCAIQLHYKLDDTETQMRLGENWRINPREGLLDSLRELPGVHEVEVCY